MLVVGPNGAGKTNLLEALHVGVQGFSPRTRAEPRLVRFGEQAARVRLEGDGEGGAVETEVTIAPGEGKRAPQRRRRGSAEELRDRLTALAFVPDRLAIVKGGPAVRRAYFDRMLGRLAPARRRPLSGEYARPWPSETRRSAARARGSRTSTRSSRGRSGVDARRRARRGGREARRGARSGVRETAAELGLPARRARLRGARLAGRRRSRQRSNAISNAGRRGSGRTCGRRDPAGDRDLRASARRASSAPPSSRCCSPRPPSSPSAAAPPLLLLDDVFSELDGDRRARCSRAAGGRQTLVTATSTDALPGARGRAGVVAVEGNASGR